MVFSGIGSAAPHRLATELLGRIHFFGLGFAEGSNKDASPFFPDADLLRSVKHPLRYGNPSLFDFYLHSLQLGMSKSASLKCHNDQLGSGWPFSGAASSGYL